MDIPGILAIAERVARNCIPELARRPLYIVQPARDSMVTPEMIGCAGLYVRGLDHALRPQLEAAGRWQGPGVCIIVDAFLTMALAADDDTGLRAVIGAVLHELAHWLDLDELTEVAPDHYSKIVAALDKRKTAPGESPDYPPGFLSHGEEFTRQCCHLWWRSCHGGGVVLGPHFLRFGNQYRGLEFLHSPDKYIAALRAELEQCKSLPLRDVAAMEQPPEYIALWRQTIREMLLAELAAA